MEGIKPSMACCYRKIVKGKTDKFLLYYCKSFSMLSVSKCGFYGVFAEYMNTHGFSYKIFG